MALSHAQPLVGVRYSLHGFLPAEDPLYKMPNENKCKLNGELNAAIDYLPELLKAKKLRAVIDILNKQYAVSPLIMIDKFNSAEVNVAYAILTMLVQAYVWERPDQPARRIPRVLAENLFQLKKINPRVPVLTYADYVLHNWRRIDSSKGITLDNIEPLFTFTGSETERYFIKVHVATEAAFSDAIAAAGSICALAQVPYENRTIEHMVTYFNKMAHSIQRATDILEYMYEGCTPTFFFNELRPYLEGVEKAKGIYFDVPDHAHEIHLYRGASGAQSSVVPALDAILRVKHENNQMAQSLSEFLGYMPVAHQAFILYLQQNKLKPLFKEFKELAYACGKAVTQLAIFRATHLGMPATYIMQPATAQGMPVEKITGTGSTNIGLFLSKRTEDTRQQAVKLGCTPQAKL